MTNDDLPDGEEHYAGPTKPQHCGSTAALAVLQALRDWGAPCGHADLLALTGLERYALSHALQGLKTRGVIDCDQRGPHARWHIVPRRCDAASAGQPGGQRTGQRTAQRSAA